MPGVMYIIEPASATALSPGSSSTSTNCISLPMILKSMSCARRPGNNRWRRGGGPRASGARKVRGELRHVLERRPVLQPFGEHQRVPVDRAVPQVGDDIVLSDGPDLMPANGHVPLLL